MLFSLASCLLGGLGFCLVFFVWFVFWFCGGWLSADTIFACQRGILWRFTVYDLSHYGAHSRSLEPARSPLGLCRDDRIVRRDTSRSPRPSGPLMSTRGPPG